MTEKQKEVVYVWKPAMIPGLKGESWKFRKLGWHQNKEDPKYKAQG